MRFDITYNGYQIFLNENRRLKYEVVGPYTWENYSNRYRTLKTAMKWIDNEVKKRKTTKFRYDLQWISDQKPQKN